jgi:hypothetical protein
MHPYDVWPILLPFLKYVLLRLLVSAYRLVAFLPGKMYVMLILANILICTKVRSLCRFIVTGNSSVDTQCSLPNLITQLLIIRVFLLRSKLVVAN